MIFEEKQQFRQWWLWVIILAVAVVEIVVLINKPNGISSIDLIISPGAILLIAILFFFVLRLETKIDESGIYYRFFPFHIKTRFKSWDEIEYAYVRQYEPISEFGGWGIRLTFGNGIALNVSGNTGLQVKYKNGKKILLGTGRQAALAAMMDYLYKKGSVTQKKRGPDNR
jgi:hypothetical protein